MPTIEVLVDQTLFLLRVYELSSDAAEAWSKATKTALSVSPISDVIG